MKKTQKANRPVQFRMPTFTPAQVKALLAVANGEMKTLVLLGATTGQRLGDLLALRWKDVDMAGGIICFRMAKAHQWLRVPMMAQLQTHLEALPKAAPDALVLPELGDRTLMAVKRQFTQLAAKAGIEGAHFRSLRMTFIRQLWDAGVPQTVAMEIMGHQGADSWKQPQSPTEALRAILNRLPPPA
jgi:integrase